MVSIMAREFESAAEARREKKNPKLEARETPAQRKKEMTPPKKKGNPFAKKKVAAGGPSGIPGNFPPNFMNK